PRVRLECLRALARIPSGWSAMTALSALEKPMDEFLDYAAWLTLNDLATPWISAIDSGIWKPEDHTKQLQFGLRAIEPELATKVLGRVIKSIPRDGSGAAIELAGQAGGPELLRKMFDQAISGGFEDRALFKALLALDDAARTRKAKPEGDLTDLSKLFQHADVGIRSAAARLAGAWKLQS